MAGHSPKAQRLAAIDALTDQQAQDLAYELAARHMSPMNLLGLYAATRTTPEATREALRHGATDTYRRMTMATAVSSDPALARQLIAENWHLPVITNCLLTTTQAARARAEHPPRTCAGVGRASTRTDENE